MILLLSILVAVATYLLYTFYYKPRQIHNQYLKTFKQLGYRVFDLPFKPFGAPIY